MSADFNVTINGPRGNEWERIAGTRRFAVTSPIPFLAHLPGFDEPQPVYLVDLAELDPATLARIVSHLGEKFALTAEEAYAELCAVGIPIWAEDCIVAIHNLMKWFGPDDYADGFGPEE